MAFGQSSGPPASAKQVQELLSLLHDAGHSDFRDARGPMGFTQRQAGGKFTREEADAFIEQLQQEAEAGSSGDAPAAPASPPARVARPKAATAKAAPRGHDSALADVPSSELAAELQRRGWVVMEP